MDEGIIQKYKNRDDKLLVAKVYDKLKFCESKNKIQTTDFFDTVQKNVVQKFLDLQKVNNYFFFGGYEESERMMLIIYPQKLEDRISNIDLNEYIKAIRITLPNEIQGEYTHRNYLGGIMKLGIEREKIGDILVDNTGADILISPEVLRFLITNIPSLIRFSKSKIEQIQIEELKQIEVKKEIITVTIPSMRLDNIVSELARCSRGKANEILEQERVLVNYEVNSKPSKEIKENDIITIRGKGRFKIKQISGNTKKGRILLDIERFCQ